MDKEVAEPLFWRGAPNVVSGVADLRKPRGLGLFALSGIVCVVIVAVLAYVVHGSRHFTSCRPSVVGKVCARDKSA